LDDAEACGDAFTSLASCFLDLRKIIPVFIFSLRERCGKI